MRERRNEVKQSTKKTNATQVAETKSEEVKAQQQKTEAKQEAKQESKQEPIKVAVNLDTAGFKQLWDQAYNDGRLSGFRDGVKYIVTLAENFLVQHKKLPGREVLSKDSTLMPTWWIATLIEALHYEPPYSPMPEKSWKIKQAESDESEDKYHA